jgi:hypothetical protein
MGWADMRPVPFLRIFRNSATGDSATTCRWIGGGCKQFSSLTPILGFRERIVLDAADKDGGAHVDAALTPMYLRLVESGDLGFFVDEHGKQTPITGHHYVALRQMGHELLDSPALVALTN